MGSNSIIDSNSILGRYSKMGSNSIMGRYSIMGRFPADTRNLMWFMFIFPRNPDSGSTRNLPDITVPCSAPTDGIRVCTAESILHFSLTMRVLVVYICYHHTSPSDDSGWRFSMTGSLVMHTEMILLTLANVRAGLYGDKLSTDSIKAWLNMYLCNVHPLYQRFIGHVVRSL